MSETQKTQAEKILDWADEMLEQGRDSIWTHASALFKLNQLGLNSFDFRYYRQRLDRVTGVK